MSGQQALDYAMAFVVLCLGVCALSGAICLVVMTIDCFRNRP